MGATSKLVELLKSNLERVPEPKNYPELRQRLAALKPSRHVPSIKESPENISVVGSSSDE